MYRIFLTLCLLSLSLLNASVALGDDERFAGASLVSKMAEVADAAVVSDPSQEGDDGALTSPYLRQPLPQLLGALQRPVPANFPTLHHPESALIRAPPGYNV